MMEEQGGSVEYLPGLTPPNEWHRIKSFNWQKRAGMGVCLGFYCRPSLPPADQRQFLFRTDHVRPLMETPANIQPHQSKYQPDAWQEYTLLELGSWVHCLAQRAAHRRERAQRTNDLEEAQNYLDMMRARLNALQTGEVSA
jgi:hypothetical protein